MIFDVIVVTVLRPHRSHSHKTRTLNKCCVCSDCYRWAIPFVSLLFPGPAYFLRHSNIDIWLTNNPTVTSKCSKGRKSHMSLTLNQKLQKIKPWWGRHVKSQDRLKAGLPVPHGQLGNAKKNFLKETKSASPISCEKWKSEGSLTADNGGSFGGLGKRSNRPQEVKASSKQGPNSLRF